MTRPGASLQSLLSRAVGHVLVGDTRTDEAEDRVLDAALRVLARRGTRAATMDDIAAESKVSRATLFRRYAGKDQLFERALAREVNRLLTDLADRFTIVTDPVDQVVLAFGAGTRLTEHILFHNADHAHRADLIHALTQGDPSPIMLAHKAIRTNIAKAQASGTIPPGDPDTQADALIHLMIGYLLTPSLVADLTDPAARDHLARTAVAPILAGHHG
ncbi:TetR/AcrR family transcriptional regulator [Amycolatopsis sp. NPDC058986]|uniref:TetR/AcrR family transcriptional regulator n=1 Tax=unclassified Amycolatopsis TaxID=2618356 RepID=UPI00366D492A